MVACHEKGPGLTLETGAKKSIAGEWLLGVGEAVGIMLCQFQLSRHMSAMSY